MESRAIAQQPDNDINQLLTGNDKDGQSALDSLKQRILTAGLQTDAAGEIIALPPTKTIYSSIIDALNDERLKINDKKTKQIRADIRSCLVKALEEKIPHLIKETNLAQLNAELAGLKTMASKIGILQGAGGFAKFNAKKGAMEKIEGFISDIKKAIKAFPVEATLIEAARVGDLEKVKRCLDQRVNIDSQDQGGRTALFWAACYGHQSVVNYLLGEGANFNIFEREYGASPLYAAAFNGHLEAVQALLGANADVNQTKKNGVTALYVAAQQGKSDVVHALIEAKADVYRPEIVDGATALYIAAQQGHDKIVHDLIGAKANVNCAIKSGATAIIIAAQEGHLAIVEFLVTQGAVLNYLTAKKYSPLTAAIHNNKLSVVTFLLKTMIRNAKLTVDEFGNVIPLPEKKTIYSFIIDALNDEKLDKIYLKDDKLRKNIRACLSEALTEKVTLVIKEGQLAHLEAELAGLKAIQSQVKLLQGIGGTGLRDQEKQAMIAVRGLIEKVASAITTTTPKAALLKAAELGNLNAVIQLIETDISIIDCQDEEDRTALYRAARNGHQNVVEYLLEKGANFNIVEKKYGGLPLDAAAFCGYLGIVKALLKAKAEVNQARKEGVTALYMAAQEGHASILDCLINEGARLDLGDNETGVLPLHIASQQGHEAVVQRLIDANVKVDQESKKGRTAIHYAVISDHDYILSQLIKAGASITKKTKEGDTAFDFISWDIFSVCIFRLRDALDKKIRSFVPGSDDATLNVGDYSRLITYFNDEEDNYKDSASLRKEMRLSLINVLTQKVHSSIHENNVAHLQAERAGLQDIQSTVRLIQGRGGALGGASAKKDAMEKMEALIAWLDAALKSHTAQVKIGSWVTSPLTTFGGRGGAPIVNEPAEYHHNKL